MTIKKPVNQEFLNNELFAAANSGDYNQVVNFIDLGAEIDSAHVYNFTSLHAAAKRGHSQIVELLIEKGAKVDSPNNSGETALYSSAAAGNTNITKLLLDAGANKDIAVHNYTPLLIAAHYERVDDVNLLLEYGANMVSDNAYTAFNVAELKGIRNVAGKLIYDNVVSHYLKSLELLPIKFEVVIARFNENLDWAVKEFPYDKVTVYNKGPDDLKLPSNFEVIPLENTGRESHSYLHHIIKNFDNLAEKTLFLQGHPYEHPVFLPLARYKESLNSTCENIIAKCTDAFPTLIAKANNLKEQLDKNFKNFEVTYDLIEFTHNFISKEYVPNTTILTVNGAQFAINKQTILNHDISYYQGLINTLTNDAHPLVGYYFERLWDLIFSHEAKIVSGNYQLFQAASKGETQEVNRLLDMGADVNSKHDFGTTALTTASFNGHYETVESLIKRGANINSTGNNGLTALYAATSKGNFAAVELLLNAGADTKLTVASGTIVDNRTPLYIAIKNRDIPAIELLLEHGANILSEDINSLLYIAAINADIERGKTEDIIKKERAIYELVINHYWKWLEHNPANVTASDRDFEVVVARYQEKDLSWLMREFPNEKVTIYNKDNETLTIEGMPNSYNIVNIPNFGWFGGTILHHIVNNYEHLANRTLFLQAAPYAVELFLPLERYKDDLPSKCENIFAKCITTSLRYESDTFAVQSRIENWSQTKYRHFEHVDYNMIDFAHKFIDPYYSPDAPLNMVWGAEFAVDSDKIYNHKKEYYEKMLAEFQKQFPMADFFLEKLWNEVFAPPKTPDQLSEFLFQAISMNDVQKVSDLLSLGANVTAINAQGDSLLNVAAHLDNSDIINLLLDAGASDKNIALTVAAYFGRYNAAKLLLESGAEVTSDNLAPPLTVSALHKDKTTIHQSIYELIINHYWNWLEHNPVNNISSQNSFEAVIVHYREDLSWVAKEFPNENVTIYNKGPDDIIDMTPNCKIVNIDNVGWFGGTILYHIVNNYDHLADKTLFVQGDPYDQEIFLPLKRYANDLPSKCKNIIAKCTETTLLEQHNKLGNETSISRAEHHKYSCFEPVNHSIIDFAQEFIDPNYSPQAPLTMVWGAQFAVSSDKVYGHEKEYYEKILTRFQKQCPMDDFFLEKLWDEVF